MSVGFYMINKVGLHTLHSLLVRLTHNSHPFSLEGRSFRSGGSSTKSFGPEAKKREGGWVKTNLENRPFVEKIAQAFLGVSDLFQTRYVHNFYIMSIKSVYFLTIFASRVD